MCACPKLIFPLHWLAYKVAVARSVFVFYQPKTVSVNDSAELGLKTMETKFF
jgi:hypothetical protein